MKNTHTLLLQRSGLSATTLYHKGLPDWYCSVLMIAYSTASVTHWSNLLLVQLTETRVYPTAICQQCKYCHGNLPVVLPLQRTGLLYCSFSVYCSTAIDKKKGTAIVTYASTLLLLQRTGLPYWHYSTIIGFSVPLMCHTL